MIVNGSGGRNSGKIRNYRYFATTCDVMLCYDSDTTNNNDIYGHPNLLKLNLGKVTKFSRGRYNTSMKNVPV